MPRVESVAAANPFGADSHNLNLLRRSYSGNPWGEQTAPPPNPWGPADITVQPSWESYPLPPIIRVQQHARGYLLRKHHQRHLRRAVGIPNLELSKELADAMLPKDQDGDLLPLSCPVECFRVYGAGLYSYMQWAVLMKRVFFICFLFSFSNMVT
jgi:hypothetical protein